MIILYIIIVLIATILGAIAGLGGGVIIKPLFDMVGIHSASAIGFYSSCAVLTMCLVSIIKQIKKGFHFDIKTIVWISLGSLVGGVLGESIFSYATKNLVNNQVKVIQALLLGITLIFILIYTLSKDKYKHYHIHNIIFIFLIGLFLGSISIFLGIGGGPLNVALLMLLFSYDMKQATIYSIATIFFSQISKLLQIIIKGQLLSFDLTLIPFLCLSAIIGGYIGTSLNQKMNNKTIEKVYMVLVISLIIICIYNIVSHI